MVAVESVAATIANPMRADLVGFALATAPGRACYVPLRHRTAEVEQIAPEQAMAALAPLLGDPAVLKVFENAKFDLMLFARAGRAAGRRRWMTRC